MYRASKKCPNVPRPNTDKIAPRVASKLPTCEAESRYSLHSNSPVAPPTRTTTVLNFQVGRASRKIPFAISFINLPHGVASRVATKNAALFTAIMKAMTEANSSMGSSSSPIKISTMQGINTTASISDGVKRQRPKDFRVFI